MVEKKKEKNYLHNKKIKLGYRVIQIKTFPPSFKKDHMLDAYGQYQERSSIMDLQEELNTLDEVNTLLHEILHASVWISSLNQNGQPLERSKDEELVVNSLTNNLVQVFIDNNWLLPYLIEKLNNKRL